MYWFTSDEHFGHHNVIEYCQRPFSSTEEMDEIIINNFNHVVGKNDIIIHGGDFTLIKDREVVYKKYVNRLNGTHIFLKGSHDRWLNGTKSNQIWEKNIPVNGKKYYFVVCHYAMRVWPRSHYGSYLIYGHSHGKLQPEGKQHDCGVDNNNFLPISDKQIVEIMESRSDNFNLIK